MKLTKQMANNFQIDVTNWAHLETYEKQGFDVSEFKEKLLAEAKIQQAVREGKIASDDRSLVNPINLEKLAPYLKAPRDPGCELVRSITKWLLFDKAKKVKELAEASLVYGAVVQAEHNLWKPGQCMYINAVFVYATDEAHKYDVVWLNRIAREILLLKKSNEVPQDMVQLVNTLREGKKVLRTRVGASVAGEAEAWCATHNTVTNGLPRQCLPTVGIVPFLLTPQKPDAAVIGELVPAKFYS
jgi:hypothetical protein